MAVDFLAVDIQLGTARLQMLLVTCTDVRFCWCSGEYTLHLRCRALVRRFTLEEIQTSPHLNVVRGISVHGFMRCVILWSAQLLGFVVESAICHSQVVISRNKLPVTCTCPMRSRCSIPFLQSLCFSVHPEAANSQVTPHVGTPC